MTSLTASFALFPLQTLQEFQLPQATPLHAAIFLVVFGGIIGIFIYLNVSKRVAQSPLMDTSVFKEADSIPVPVPAASSLRKVMRAWGLGMRERRFLSRLVQESGRDAKSIFSDKESTDSFFADAYRDLSRDIEGDDENGLENLATFFTIRNVAEYFQSGGANFGASRTFSTPLPASAILVKTIKKGKIRKLVPTGGAFRGGFTQISIRGGLFQTFSPLKPGQIVKIECNLGRNKAALLANVESAEVKQAATLAHLSFLKIPLGASCNLNAFLYDYA